MKQSRRRFWFAAASLATFVLSCALPAVGFDPVDGIGGETDRGLEAYVFGSAMLAYNAAWLANPISAIGWLLLVLGYRRAAAGFASVGLLVALDAFFFIGARLPIDPDAVRTHTMEHLYAGFYAWLASMAITVAGSFWPPNDRKLSESADNTK